MANTPKPVVTSSFDAPLSSRPTCRMYKPYTQLNAMLCCHTLSAVRSRLQWCLEGRWFQFFLRPRWFGHEEQQKGSFLPCFLHRRYEVVFTSAVFVDHAEKLLTTEHNHLDLLRDPSTRNHESSRRCVPSNRATFIASDV